MGVDAATCAVFIFRRAGSVRKHADGNVYSTRCRFRERSPVRGGGRRRFVQSRLGRILQPPHRLLDPPPHHHEHGTIVRRRGCDRQAAVTQRGSRHRDASDVGMCFILEPLLR